MEDVFFFFSFRGLTRFFPFLLRPGELRNRFFFGPSTLVKGEKVAFFPLGGEIPLREDPFRLFLMTVFSRSDRPFFATFLPTLGVRPTPGAG